MASLKIVFDVIVKLFNIKTLKNMKELRKENIKKYEGLKSWTFLLKIVIALDHVAGNGPKTMIHDQKHIQSLKNFLVIFVNGFASIGTFDLA